MQLINFTQKLLRQRRFFSSLIPLLALFVGLGASQSALAQAAVTANAVTLDIRGTSSTFDTQNNTPGPGVFAGNNFGTFNLANATDVFTLNGATLTINDQSGAYNDGQLLYRIYQTGGIVPGFTTISLGTGTRSGGVRTFTVIGLGNNLLVGLTGGAGTGYSFDVIFRANDNNSFGNPITSFPVKTATFTVTGAPVPPTSIGPPTNPQGLIFIGTPGMTPAAATYMASSFQGANLGTFDINTGQLLMNGGTVTTNESNGDMVLTAILNFRVFKNGQAPGTFSSFALNQVGTVSSTGVRQFSLNNQQRNVVASLANSGTGTFNFQVSFQADGQRANGTFFTLTDNNGGSNYTATFMTNGTPIQTDTWTGAKNDDWFDGANWTLGAAPTALTNVAIPNFAAGDPSPYPNIYSNSTFVPSYNPTFTGTRSSPVNNSASGPALARNLNLQGFSSTTDRSILRLNVGTLKIYGDFTNQFLSYIARDNTTTEFAGSFPQQVAQGSYAIVIVSGGGTKNITGPVLINEALMFNASNGNTIVRTDPAIPGISYIQLADRLTQNNDQGAQLVNETNTSYVFGLIRTTRANVVANEVDAMGNPATRTLGDIGFTFRFTGSANPGDVEITRSTESNYALMGNRISVRRVFGVRPSNALTSQGRLRADVTFKTLQNETVNLQPNNSSIAEQDLVLFLSTNNGNTFGFLGRDGAVVNYTVTKLQVANFATFTLGDRMNPLPVRLTAFDATRIGSDALVTWQTASEVNSRGYDVQVSTNGTEFRTLTSVPSASPNSVRLTSYSYLDTEKNKSGLRYYRLRQVDLDGKEEFFAPKTVSFEGKAPATTLAAYPNPFDSNDQLHLAIQSVATGKGQVRITDMTGRVIRQESVEINKGLTDLEVNGLADLKSGLYVVNVTLPTGETKNLKIVKQ